jgi:hypothetical protein
MVVRGILAHLRRSCRLVRNGRDLGSGYLFRILKRPHASEVPDLALPVQLVVAGLVLWLTHTYSRAIGGGNWAARIPIIPFFDERDIDPQQSGGKLIQGAVIALSDRLAPIGLYPRSDLTSLACFAPHGFTSRSVETLLFAVGANASNSTCPLCAQALSSSVVMGGAD